MKPTAAYSLSIMINSLKPVRHHGGFDEFRLCHRSVLMYRHILGLPDGHSLCHQRVRNGLVHIIEDELRGAFSNHDGWGIGVARWNQRHDGSIGNA